jgi:glucuronokinase
LPIQTHPVPRTSLSLKKERENAKYSNAKASRGKFVVHPNRTCIKAYMPLPQNTYFPFSFMIETTAYPRAALIGNPSDGYFGKTIAFTFKNFEARVQLEESKALQIVPCERENLQFSSVSHLTNEVKQYGYYGGVRLIKAAIKTLVDYCSEHNIKLADKNFTLSYSSSIPGRLGLAGSSAIVTAAMKGMMEFYGIDIPRPILANLILAVEKKELNIGAGLQDRVAQVYGRPVYMNFDKTGMDAQGYGEYISFEPALLPNIYLAYRNNLAEGSEMTHNDLAKRFANGDAAVLDAIEKWKALTDELWRRLNKGNKNIGDLIDRNFDIRKSVCVISEGNMELISAARASGASAKFTGSGGATIGTYTDEAMYEKLVKNMMAINASVIKPIITE